MAVLVSVRGLSHAFGARPLFRDVAFTVSVGDRIGLIGPNGAGKSTLLRILAGALAPDQGDVERRSELRIALVEQVPTLTNSTVRDAVTPSTSTAAPSWEDEARVDEWLSKLDLDPDATLAELSGGWQKRVALARALVTEPELLLLDEPTNHLDVESIIWLERLLAQQSFATMTITHDRAFLQNVSNRILELDRRNPDGLLDVRGDYLTYVERKAETMQAQEQHQERLENTLRRETEWLRRGPKARSTKQRARIQRAADLKGEVRDLDTRNRKAAISIDFQHGKKRPKRLIETRGVEKRFGDHLVVQDVSLFIGPKTRLGLLGPNGCGKSTLLGVLTGALEPSAGEVLRADELSTAYFEQDRESLDQDASVADAICPHGDYVEFRGSRLHRHGYLERFAFRPDQMRQPVASLSGGEQSRLLVAQLMLQPADILILDEPTNDLDLETLNVLEDALTSFDGAVILVTHDRYFLDQVATELLAFHTKPGERGRVTSLVGLDQWETWLSTQRPEKKTSSGQPAAAPGKKRKLSFDEQREWDGLEERILTAERKLSSLETECEHEEVAVDPERLGALAEQMTGLRSEIDTLYARWAELEALVADPARLH